MICIINQSNIFVAWYMLINSKSPHKYLSKKLDFLASLQNTFQIYKRSCNEINKKLISEINKSSEHDDVDGFMWTVKTQSWK